MTEEETVSNTRWGTGRDLQAETPPTQSPRRSVPGLRRDSKEARVAAAGAGRCVPWRERERERERERQREREREMAVFVQDEADTSIIITRRGKRTD